MILVVSISEAMLECWIFSTGNLVTWLADKHVIIFTRDTITGVLGGCSIITRSGLGGQWRRRSCVAMFQRLLAPHYTKHSRLIPTVNQNK